MTMRPRLGLLSESRILTDSTDDADFLGADPSFQILHVFRTKLQSLYQGAMLALNFGPVLGGTTRNPERKEQDNL